MKIIGKNAKKWKFSEISMIFTEKSAYQAENRDLWKITKNVITHHQIVRFGSFLDMLVLTTSRIGFGFKILIFPFFSEKSPIFIQKRRFWLKISDFSLKNENIKILTPKPILLVVRTNISKNEPNRTIWWWVSTFFVIFHKSRFSVCYADFSVKIIDNSLNFHFSAFLPINFKSVY